MPLNDQARALLEATAAGMPLPLWSPAEARAAAWDWLPYMGEPEPVAQVEHLYVPGSTAELPVTVYTPAGDGPFPGLVWLHGGGWVVGNTCLVDRPSRALANATGCVLVAVNYQKAPEHPFPTAADDALAAFHWVVQQASRLGVDPSRVGVGGDSAGGNLAAVVALRADPAFQLLIYPALDPELCSCSARENAEGYGLTTDDMRWFWRQYLAHPDDRDNPFANPLKAEDLSDLAPAVVVTVEYDPLRDEARTYADRLTEAGVHVIRHEYPGTIHGLLWMATALDEYRTLLSDLGRDVPALLHRQGVLT